MKFKFSNTFPHVIGCLFFFFFYFCCANWVETASNLWFWFVFSQWQITLGVFLCPHQPFIYLLWKIVYSNPLPIILKKKKKCLFVWKAERERLISRASSLSKWLQHPKLRETNVRSQEPHCDLSNEEQNSNIWVIFYYLPRHISKSCIRSRPNRWQFITLHHKNSPYWIFNWVIFFFFRVYLTLSLSKHFNESTT